MNYYNEIDPYAAQWLRNLIDAGHIARGDVDERSIVDVRPDELAGYTQCHFFAGVGGWSVALRLAGWPDNRPVWTGSCPCQPFSAAGKGEAADDERHLWPAWFPLIAQRRPPVVFGEQVEAAVGWGWLDAVFADLEGEGYACGAAILPACGVGAPHIRARAWFVADSDSEPIRGRPGGNGSAATEICETEDERERLRTDDRPDRPTRELADAVPTGRPEGRPSAGNGPPPRRGIAGELADAGHKYARRPAGTSETETRRPFGDTARRSAWADLDWLPCTDRKARPVEPGTFPLAHGIPGRVGRLRAYGNAIVPQVAAEFIKAASD